MGVTTPTTDQTVATDSPTASNGVNLGARAQVATKVTNVSTWTELETAVKAIASKDGTVMITPALGLITVRDPPDRLGHVQTLPRPLPPPPPPPTPPPPPPSP